MASLAVTCLASETVRDVVERMNPRRVHHVYVCDDERRPVAMVTPNDVLAPRMSWSRGRARKVSHQLYEATQKKISRGLDLAPV